MSELKEQLLIESVSDFISRIQHSPEIDRRLFRGQPTDKPLLPRIVRLANERNISLNKLVRLEKKMLDRFRRESHPMLQSSQEPMDLELLSLAQHFGMPTRLLDWTANALTGLWFAVASDLSEDEDHGVVWAINNPDVKEFSIEDNIFSLDKTYFFKPSHLDRRIAAQFAWLSIQRPGSNRKFLPLEDHEKFRDRLIKYIIPGEQFELIRKELRYLGVNHVTLFPDLSGLAADIEVEIMDSWRSI